MERRTFLKAIVATAATTAFPEILLIEDSEATPIGSAQIALVREIVLYDISRDCFMASWDIRTKGTNWIQLNVSHRLSKSSDIEAARPEAIKAMHTAMRTRGISARDLVTLEIPEDFTGQQLSL